MKPKICVVVSEFNKVVTAEIQDRAVHELNDKGITGEEYLKVIYVKGAFEIPYASNYKRNNGHINLQQKTSRQCYYYLFK